MNHGFERTGWMERLLHELNGRRSPIFLLYGDTTDEYPLVHDGRPVLWPIEQYLRSQLSWAQLMVRYSRSGGIEVVLPYAEELTELERDMVAGRAADVASPEDDQPAAEGERVLRELARETRRGDAPAEPVEAFRMVDRLLRTQENVVVLVPWAQHLFPHEPGQGAVEQRVLVEYVHRWTHDPDILTVRDPESNGRRRRNVALVFIARDLESLSEDLTHKDTGVTIVEVPRPEEADRLGLINLLGSEGMFPREEGFTEKQAALLTGGLTYRDIRDLGVGAARRQEALGPAYIAQRKHEYIAAETGGALKVMRSSVTFDQVGGLQHLKDEMAQLAERFRDADDASRASLPVLVVLAGPPGTGKSMVAKALADEWGASYAELADVRSMWVGESERRLSQAISVLKSIAPVAVFVDEIEKEFEAAHDASGVGNHLLRRLLQHLSDESIRGRVLWVTATNYPNRLDPALLSRNLLYPVLPPNAEARVEIIASMEAQTHVPLGPDVDLAEAAGLTAGLSGRDIRSVYDFACHRKPGPEMDRETLHRCLTGYIPNTGWAERYMTLLAVRSCRFMELVPDVELPWIETAEGGPMTARRLVADPNLLESELERALLRSSAERG